MGVSGMGGWVLKRPAGPLGDRSPTRHHSTQEDRPLVLLQGGWGWWMQGRSGGETGRLKSVGFAVAEITCGVVFGFPA